MLRLKFRLSFDVEVLVDFFEQAFKSDDATGVDKVINPLRHTLFQN